MYQQICDNFTQVPSNVELYLRGKEYFWPLINPERISLKSLFFGLKALNTAALFEYRTEASLGIYSLTGGTLTLLNSGSFSSSTSTTFPQSISYLSITNWDNTLDLSPGNWWLGGIVRVSVTIAGHMDFEVIAAGGSALGTQGIKSPTGLVGGYFSTSTTSWPRASLSTNQIRQGNFGITTVQAWRPHIILSS